MEEKIKIIDAHTHVQFEQYDQDREEVIARSLEKGIGMINVGADLKSSKEAISLAHQYQNLWATVGLHPHEVQNNTHAQIDESLKELENLIQDDKVVAVGECGLDFYFQNQNQPSQDQIKRQKDLFVAQIQLAYNFKKPLVIHCRQAFEEVFEIIEANKNWLLDRAGIFHFFTGQEKEAKKALDLGFSFTFGGLITYNHQFDEVIKFIPKENILVETDAPFVSPVPHRKERNEPSFVVFTVKRLAEIKGFLFEDMSQITLENTVRVFGLSL